MSIPKSIREIINPLGNEAQLVLAKYACIFVTRLVLKKYACVFKKYACIFFVKTRVFCDRGLFLQNTRVFFGFYKNHNNYYDHFVRSHHGANYVQVY